MKRSIFLTSFFPTNGSASNPRTSPAIRLPNFDASNRVIGPIPLWPSMRAVQVASVPTPHGVIRPTPVTTTRLFKRLLHFLLEVLVDVSDRVADRRDLLRVLVADLEVELLLERHDELDRVERVRAQIVDERRGRHDLFRVHAKLFDNDSPDLFLDVHLDSPPWLHVHAAVDTEHLPRDVTRGVARQEQRRSRHVGGGAESRQRDQLEESRLDLVGEL